MIYFVLPKSIALNWIEKELLFKFIIRALENRNCASPDKFYFLYWFKLEKQGKKSNQKKPISRYKSPIIIANQSQTEGLNNTYTSLTVWLFLLLPNRHVKSDKTPLTLFTGIIDDRLIGSRDLMLCWQLACHTIFTFYILELPLIWESAN
jgi:hypothetical protein